MEGPFRHSANSPIFHVGQDGNFTWRSAAPINSRATDGVAIVTVD